MGKELRSKEHLATQAYLESIGIPTLGEIKAPGKMEGGDVLWIDEKPSPSAAATARTTRASASSRS